MAEEQTVAETVDEFDTAFEALLNGPPEDTDDQVTDDQVTEEAPETEEETQAEKNSDDTEEPEVEAETKAEDESETETTDEPEESEDDRKRREAAERNAEINRKREEAEQKAAEEQAAAEEAKQKAEEEARANLPDPGIPSEDEQALLDKFKEEWPDHYPAIKVLLDLQRKESEAKYVQALQSVTEKIYQDINPVAESASQTAAEQHFNSIRSVHSDFDNVKEKLGPWIESQPPYLAKAMKTVYTSGNADEVIDLIQRYKDTNGIASPEPGANPSPKSKPAVNEKKLDALESVGSKRTTPQQRGVDVNDFDGAFNEAVSKLV